MNAHAYGGFEPLEIEPPKPPDQTRTILGFTLGAAILLIAVVMWDGMISIIVAVMGMWMLLVFWGLGKIMTVVQYRQAHVSEHYEGLSFVPPPAIERLENLITWALLVPWLVLVTSLLTPDAARVISSVWMPVGLVAFPVILMHYLWQMARSRGLTLTPEGIHGVRRGPKVQVAWDDIVSVDVSDLPGRGKLVIEKRGPKLIHIDSTRFGSDARVVAHIINHYRENPSQRLELAQGARILARFGATTPASN